VFFTHITLRSVKIKDLDIFSHASILIKTITYDSSEEYGSLILFEHYPGVFLTFFRGTHFSRGGHDRCHRLFGSIEFGPHSISLVRPYQEDVNGWWKQGIVGTTIHQALVRKYGFAGSYSSVRRYLAGLEGTD
jgi:hypothetical protein